MQITMHTMSFNIDQQDNYIYILNNVTIHNVIFTDQVPSVMDFGILSSADGSMFTITR